MAEDTDLPARVWWTGGEALAGAVPIRAHRVDAEHWTRAAADLAAAEVRLLSVWATARGANRGSVQAAFLGPQGIVILELALRGGPESGAALRYPSLEPFHPAAARMERAIRDLTGFEAETADRRPWLRHGPGPYAFVRVAGDGVHEIPVGPVHAGIIEPGHFRFSVVGEKVLRLEERLGYVHKGIEQRFTTLATHAGHRLAARVSGDSAVAYSWAYCQALENLAAAAVPRRGLYLRALALEIERLQNHLGDLGALGNDAGFGFGLAQFSRLKELLLRAVEASLGERYLLDFVVPGGVARDPDAGALARLAARVREVTAETRTLRAIYGDHAGLRDRFVGAGVVTPSLARRLGLTGLAGRASGQDHDLRADLRPAPYDEFGVVKFSLVAGDVAARVELRFREVEETGRLLGLLLERLPDGPTAGEVGLPPAGALGLGLVEGWRGPVLVALEPGPEGRIVRCHPHDPSWQNWPVLEHAIIGNIVPDFPLINKSFNLSYSGHDL